MYFNFIWTFSYLAFLSLVFLSFFFFIFRLLGFSRKTMQLGTTNFNEEGTARAETQSKKCFLCDLLENMIL